MVRRSGQITVLAIVAAATAAALVVALLLMPGRVDTSGDAEGANARVIPGETPGGAYGPEGGDTAGAVESPGGVADPDGSGIQAQERYRLALVLDDAGHRAADLQRFASFPGHINVAILPGRPEAGAAVAAAREAGYSILLHQPMESLRGNDPGPGAIRVGDSAEQIQTTLRANLALVPGSVAVNNHMGSAATLDAQLMRSVLSVLADEGLIFLDSVTVSDSVAYDTARAMGVPALKRDVFLDNTDNAAEIEVQLERALAIARRSGAAVMIGHVTSTELAGVLERRYPALVESGFDFVPLSDLVQANAP